MSDDFLQSDESQQFFGLVQMLQRSALVAMGRMPDHEGNFTVNLAEAKAAIDLIAVIDKRTNGNLDSMEEQLLRGIISELKMAFVQAPRHTEEKEMEEEVVEELKKTFTKPTESQVEVVSPGNDSEEE
tara:strand:+ start:246 stop:629 length:384 start_codon:yes stop_codon:yes gene_type:complete